MVNYLVFCYYVYMAKKFVSKLIKKEKIATDTWEFLFKKPLDYYFFAGQYQTYFLDLPDKTTISRDMTIASSPSENVLRLITKIPKHHSPFKELLLHMKDDSNITIQGPQGGFYIREENALPHVLIAGGIGNTVFYSLMKDIKVRNLNIDVILFASFKHKNDIILFDEFKSLENNKRKVIYTLTQEKWEGENGRITEEMIKKYVPQFKENIFMIAGGLDFVDSMSEMVGEMGILAKNIKLDYFTGY